jgi:predicted nucleic acid-binding protein
VLLDTCVVLLFADPDAERRAPELRRRVAELLAQAPPNISRVTVYELRRAPAEGARAFRRRAQIERLLRSANVLGLDDGGGIAWDVAARVWALGREQSPHVLFGDADLFIVATAIMHGMALLTTDARLANSLERVGHGERVELLPVK